MKQRISLIRTIGLKPSLLLLDEPFSQLDYQSRLSISSDIHKLVKDHNITVILITHDISEAISLSDRIIVLSKRPAHVKNIYTLEQLSTVSRYFRMFDTIEEVYDDLILLFENDLEIINYDEYIEFKKTKVFNSRHS